MFKTTISLLIGASLMLLGAQFAHGRGCGGARGGGEYHGGGSAGGYHEGGQRGGESRGGYSSGGQRGSESFEGGERGGRDTGAEGAAAGRSTTDRNSQEYSGKQGVAAGATAANRNSPQYSGKEGAAAGAAATNRNSPKYSGAEGAAAGATAANRNSPQYSGAQGAAAGAAAANRNTPKYSGAQGAAAGAAVANRNFPQYSGAEGAAAGYAAANRNTYPAGASQVSLPTDAGYGMVAARTGSTAYAGYHQTEAAAGNVYAARGATVRSSYNGYDMYGAAWHAANPGAWSAAGWKAGYAWTPATWPIVGTAFGWGTGVQPIPYNYGENITYQDNQVFQGSQPVATAEQYYQQASTLAQNAPPADVKADEWTPLGVFAFVQKEQSEPHYIMHLAVSQSGAIGGNYTDTVSGTTVPIQGAVDKKSQRAAWTVGKNKTTVCEAGIYNLTQDEAPALLHIGKDKTQQWLLVRLKQPQ